MDIGKKIKIVKAMNTLIKILLGNTIVIFLFAFIVPQYDIISRREYSLAVNLSASLIFVIELIIINKQYFKIKYWVFLSAIEYILSLYIIHCIVKKIKELIPMGNSDILKFLFMLYLCVVISIVWQYSFKKILDK